MKRDKTLQNIRVSLVKKAVNNPKDAANELRGLAEALENTRTFSDQIYALSRIFGVSERTILRDLSK